VLLPISAIVCPFVTLVGRATGTGFVVFHFFWVMLSVSLLFNAWVFERQGHSILYLRPRTTDVARKILPLLKRFYSWAWLTWLEYLAYLFLYVASPLYVLLGTLREAVFTISLRSKVWAKDHPTFFSGLMFMFYLQVAFGIPSVAYAFLGKGGLFEGIIGAVAVITFVALQFQRMTPPYFVPTFVDSHSPSFGDGTFRIKAKSATPTWLYIRITNLGISTYKDCVLQVTFPQGFSVLDDFDSYRDEGHAKHFAVVRETNTIVEFRPRDNYMTFAPCTSLIFPIYVRTPEEPAEYRLVTSLSSESAWGLHHQALAVAVTNE